MAHLYLNQCTADKPEDNIIGTLCLASLWQREAMDWKCSDTAGLTQPIQAEQHHTHKSLHWP